MSNGKSKAAAARPGAAQPTTAPPAPPAARPAHIPPLFRPIDWLTFGVTTLLVWIGYYLTLAPDLTLEDSGELAVASYYAGIPHPPGYPVWTIYTWLWAVLLPFSNVAWRVALGSATAGAFACGLLGLLVSRGSSMMIEGITDLKNIDRRWENVICVVSGFVAGTLLGFNGYMWSQSVIVEVYSFSVLSLMGVMLGLLRWTYAPHQHRYLYLAFFLYGICFNNHQSLLVIALGMEALILVVQPKLAREMFFWNTVTYIGGLILGQKGYLNVMTSNMPVFVIFNIIGLVSVGVWAWLSYRLKRPATGILGAIVVVFAVLQHLLQHPVYKSAAAVTFALIWMVGSRLVEAYWTIFVEKTRGAREWAITLGCGGSWIAGTAFYLYMPLAGMTNPPMQWGYPRTVEGFFHAFTRGQYEKIHPTSGVGDTPFEVLTSFLTTYSRQLGMFLEGLNDEFNLVYLLIALVMFFYYRRMQTRERAWTLGVTALFICLGPFLVLLLNPPPDRAARELIRVFFTASHTLVAMAVGYGLTLIAATLATQYQRFRPWCWAGGAVAMALALFSLASTTQAYVAENFRGSPLQLFFHAIARAFDKDQYGLPIFAGLLLLASTAVFTAAILLKRVRPPLTVTLALFAAMPLYSVMTHWFENEQRGHLFGYWFGHDMFTPPFAGPDGKFGCYDPKARAEMMKDPEKAKFIYPEMTRDAILYGGTDPGRFCPTYMIFCESFIPPECKKNTDPNFDRRDVYIITQNALADGTYLNYIRAHYHRSAQKRRGLDTPFFQNLVRSQEEKEKNWTTNTLARILAPLDRWFERLGESIEHKRRAGSSYFTPSDFMNLPSLAARLRQPTNEIARQVFDQLSPDTRKLLDGGDETSLRKALAKDLNRVIEQGLYDDKPLARKVEERWQAIFDLEAIQNEKQRVQHLGPDIVARVAAQELAAQKRVDGIQAELARMADQVAAQLTQRGIPLTPHLRAFILEAPQSATRVRLNRQLLEAAFPQAIAVSPGGVYPDREMYIASPMDSQQCFQEYLADAQARLQHDRDFPHEPRRIKPGEDVRFVDQKVQVSGQVAVMSINGLLTKVMFDRNPDNEFFVEESFPLEWMYPHLTPFGIIMKVNRQPLVSLSEDILQRDHEFWSRYCERLIGNWITYDTSVKEIADFAEKVYLRRDFRGFKGDRKFVRDDQAQKAFSKLRSSIGGVYFWRVDRNPTATCPPQYRPKTDAEFQRLIKEADFTFRQAFALCPYSPEAVFRYVQLLTQLNRFQDALIVAETCLKLDPYNGQVIGLVNNLRDTVKRVGEMDKIRANFQQMEDTVRKHPTNYQAAFDLASAYLSMQQTNHGVAVLERMVRQPAVDPQAVLAAARVFAEMRLWPQLELTLERMVQLMPNEPEPWYDLAALKAGFGKSNEALPALARALELNTRRLEKNPAASNLLVTARDDPRFTPLRALPEFQKLVGR